MKLSLKMKVGLAGAAAAALAFGVYFFVSAGRSDRKPKPGSDAPAPKTDVAQPSTPPKRSAQAAPRIASPVPAPSEARQLSETDRAILACDNKHRLLHELLVSGDQFLEDSGLAPMDGPPNTEAASPLARLAQQVRQAADRAFFDVLHEGMSCDPPQLARLVALILDVKGQLLEVTPPQGEGAQIRAQLQEKLEEAYLSERLSFHPPDVEYLTKVLGFLVETIMSVEAPARNAATRTRFSALVASIREAAAPADGDARRRALADHVVAACKFIREKMAELHRDIARARVGILRGLLAGTDSGVDHERALIGSILGKRAPAEAFPRTAAWLAASKAQLASAAQADGGVAPSEDEAVQRAVVAGYIRLLKTDRAVAWVAAPETLFLDEAHIIMLQNGLQRASLLALAVQIANQMLKRKQVAPTQALMQGLVDRLGVLLKAPTDLESLVLEISSRLEAHCSAAGVEWRASTGRTPERASPGPTSPTSPGASSMPDEAIVRNMVRNLFDTSSSVFRRVQGAVAMALERRVLGVLTAPGSVTALSVNSGGQPQSAATWMAPLRAAGAAMLAPEVEEMASVLTRLISVNLAVSGRIYAGILREVPVQA